MDQITEKFISDLAFVPPYLAMEVLRHLITTWFRQLALNQLLTV
jgi:hypothetical protein